MPKTDMFGYDITVSNDEAVRAWSDLTRAFLSHSDKAPELLKATIDTDPDFALAHAAKGLFFMLAGRAEMVDAAREAHRDAVSARARAGMTERETGYLEALELWLEGRMRAAADKLNATLAAYPRDALVLKLAHAVYFMLGAAPEMRRSIEAVLSAHDDTMPMTGYVHGCHSFTLEETGDYRAAEIAGKRALLLARDDAWALHAVAHVYDMTGRAKDGVQWIEKRPESWANCNNFRYHVWWHKALFHLDLGEVDEVLALYDDEIRRDKTDDYRDISNAASLLCRLEIEDVDVGRRWEELADMCERRTDDTSVVFADMHYLLALLGDNREDAAARLVRSVRTAGARHHGDMDDVAAAAGVPLGAGLTAFRDGHYDLAYRQMGRGCHSLKLIGGSHAQRDVFERVHVEAAIRAGRLHEARGLLYQRLTKRGREDGYTARRLAFIERAERVSPGPVQAWA